jgi:hypothetical protein
MLWYSATRNGRRRGKYLQQIAYGRQHSPFKNWIISALTDWSVVSVFYLAERVLCLDNMVILCNFIPVLELRVRVGLFSDACHLTSLRRNLGVYCNPSPIVVLPTTDFKYPRLSPVLLRVYLSAASNLRAHPHPQKKHRWLPHQEVDIRCRKAGRAVKASKINFLVSRLLLRA